MAELRNEHTIWDLLGYVEWLEWKDACAQDEAEQTASK